MAAEPRLTCLGFCGADDSVDPRLLAAVSEVRHMLGGFTAVTVDPRLLAAVSEICGVLFLSLG